MESVSDLRINMLGAVLEFIPAYIQIAGGTKLNTDLIDYPIHQSR